MDRRFSNATSSLVSAALKLCIKLARYWRTVLADQGYRPAASWIDDGQKYAVIALSVKLTKPRLLSTGAPSSPRARNLRRPFP